MSCSFFHSSGSCFLLASLSATALTHPVGAYDNDADHPIDLAPLVVTGTVGASSVDEVVSPTFVLLPENIATPDDRTLGDLLAGTPGVSSTSYGAGANRPVIRGYAGDRIRILSGGLEVQDASAASPDHAVALDPALIEQVEIVRGAGVLLYGGSAIGGVINAADRRFPSPEAGEGSPSELLVQSRYHSVSDGWDALGFAQAGEKNWTLTTSYVRRDYEDYRIPGNAESAAYHEAAEHEEHDEDAPAHGGEGRLESSFLNNESGSLAGSWSFGNGGNVRLGWLHNERTYGVPGHSHGHEHEEDHEGEDHADEDHHDEGHEEGHEEGVYIDLKQTSTRADASLPLPSKFFPELRLQAKISDYEHSEMEGDEVGTRFANDAHEVRLELDNRGNDKIAGRSGLQWTEIDAFVEGEEAATPPTDTRDVAIFSLQEYVVDSWRAEVGMRLEERTIEAEGFASGYDELATSFALGLSRSLGRNFNASLLLTRAQRHPGATALYADGPHAATRRFEIGDASLGRETVHGGDLTVRLLDGPITGSITAFYHRFSDYIYSIPLGLEEDGFDVFQYVSTDATFYGGEAAFTWHALHRDGEHLHVSWLMDLVRAKDARAPLREMPPLRMSWEVDYRNGPWALFARVQHAWAQKRIAANELPTDAYTQTNLGLRYRWSSESWRATVTLSVANLFDEEIRHHTSPLKDLAPLPGRNVSLGLRLDF